MSDAPLNDDRTRPDPAAASPELDGALDLGLRLARRSFVMLGALAIAGCATSTATQTASSRMPAPEWPDIPEPPDAPPAGTQCVPDPKSIPQGPIVSGEYCTGGPVPFAIRRTAWTRGQPDTANMEPMLPPKYITIHHDGINAFWGTSEAESRARLELVRNGHRGRGWADIGYHYVVDRAGRVWQARDVTKWQGAHVKNRNENNIGVMCLGNFCEQSPSAAQVEALNRTVAQLRAYYRIPAANVYTHREWKGAHTVCPGDALQSKVLVLRRAGFNDATVAGSAAPKSRA
jgi:hypothetical protein